MGTKLAETEARKWLRGQKVAKQWIEVERTRFPASGYAWRVVADLSVIAGFGERRQESNRTVSAAMENAASVRPLARRKGKRRA